MECAVASHACTCTQAGGARARTLADKQAAPQPHLVGDGLATKRSAAEPHGGPSSKLRMMRDAPPCASNAGCAEAAGPQVCHWADEYLMLRSTAPDSSSRVRIAQLVVRLCTAPETCAVQADDVVGAPFGLLWLRHALSAPWNHGAFGVKLRNLLTGSMQLVLVSNFMVDVPFLVSVAPDLLCARQLLLLHGQSQPDTEAAAHEVFHGSGCEVRYVLEWAHWPLRHVEHGSMSVRSVIGIPLPCSESSDWAISAPSSPLCESQWHRAGRCRQAPASDRLWHDA